METVAEARVRAKAARTTVTAATGGGATVVGATARGP